MALDLPYKLQTFFIIKLLPLTREYQYIDTQSLTHRITLEPLLINFNYLLQYTRKSIQRRYKPSLQTDDSIKEIIIIIIVTVATPCITATERDYIALYIIGKDVAYRDILKRNKESLKLSLELLIEIDFINLITDLRNNLTIILQIIRIVILTQKKSLRKLFKY